MALIYNNVAVPAGGAVVYNNVALQQVKSGNVLVWQKTPPFLYNSGNSYSEYTGGWTGFERQTQYGDCVQIAESNALYAYAYGMGISGVRTAKAVDFSLINTLTLNFWTSVDRDYAHIRVCLTTFVPDGNNMWTDRNTAAPGQVYQFNGYDGNNATRNIGIDVSGYKNSYYVSIFFHSADLFENHLWPFRVYSLKCN
ncbi:hypothetical protein H8S23_13635 [Anaerofilum sp. BX8]|uniref:Uncharacterized protein n=1 Tax=Anaerofilum hominis TaxID=2763016 RepID=A0A923L2A7_9FIRM|nr:hypothetical protein [Anaerofilum hominis]MBC5582549.1 hypothetical protein [Anaerofilum hominis]